MVKNRNYNKTIPTGNENSYAYRVPKMELTATNLEILYIKTGSFKIN